MEKIFYPESVVIIGLSSKTSNVPRITLENMLRWGYRGRIFGVNPSGQDAHVDGIRMYKSIEDLPEVPDLAFCMVPARYVPEMVENCGKVGIKRMAIPTAGFGEFNEEGKRLANLTRENAIKYGVKVVGPNAVTVANTANGMCLPFVPLHRARSGGMSIIAQSGGVSLMMLSLLFDENVGLAKFASIGNKLVLDEVDFLEYFGSDPDTKIICLYLESIARGKAFVEAAKKIDKPIVVYKSNTTNAGKNAAMSHTAAVSNDEDIIDSALEGAGVIRISNFRDFISLAKAFQLPPMKGKRVMVMSPAGGFAVMTADLCEKAGFDFANMGDDFYSSLQAFSNAGVIKFSNPLDMGDIYDPKFSAHVVYSVMHSPQVDGAVFVGQRPQTPRGENVLSKLFSSDLSKETWGTILSSGKPLAVCLFGPMKKIQETKRSVEFPVFDSPEEMVTAMAFQMKFNCKKISSSENNLEGIDLDAARGWMSGKSGDFGEESMELLNHFGIITPESVVASNSAEAVKCASRISFPVVMKVVSPDALHKSDVGGVVVGVKDADEVKAKFSAIRDNLLNLKKDARFEGIRIQQMAGDGYDMFVGGKYDESFGPVVFFGMGGIYIELFRDVANALCPAGSGDVRVRLERLKAFSILNGLRGKKRGDIDSFINLVVRVSQLLSAFPEIKELDINPVRVFAEGCGVMALDARMRVEKP